jgi:hypothetical protein
MLACQVSNPPPQTTQHRPVLAHFAAGTGAEHATAFEHKRLLIDFCFVDSVYSIHVPDASVLLWALSLSCLAYPPVYAWA